jgi:hypothetical protein
MLYSGKDNVSVHRLNSVIQELYRLKREGVKLAKPLLNTIWGAVCQKDKEIHRTTNEEEILINSSDRIIPLRTKGEYEVEKFNVSKIFRSPWARMGVFLTAKARVFMSRQIEPFKDDIVYIHTDGFVSKKPLTLATTKDIGGWKQEQKGVCKVISRNKKTFL